MEEYRVRASCPQHPFGQSASVSGSNLLMKCFSLLWPLRNRNMADRIVLFLLVCHGKYPKHYEQA